MANAKISALTALGAAPATNDLIPVVDVSDLTDAATGTTKKMTVANLMTTPTIASFTNAQHNHEDAAGGGQIDSDALSGAVSIAKGGTGQTSQTNAFDALAPTTTAGDLIYHNGSDNIRLAKGTAGQVLKMNDAATAPEWGAPVSVPYFQQTLVGSPQPMIVPSSGSPGAFGSNADGSVLIHWQRINASGTYYLQRFARESVTGQYLLTHSVQTTRVFTANETPSIVVIGSFIYVFTNDGTNIVSTRFALADCSGETNMTVPTVACNNDLVAWTNGTLLYVVSADSATTSNVWTVSGTTFSASTTATISTPFGAGDPTSTFYDGTYAYRVAESTNTVTITKITTLDGSVATTTTKIIPPYSDAQYTAVGVNIDSTKMYIGICAVYYDETAIVSVHIHLFPIAKP